MNHVRAVDLLLWGKSKGLPKPYSLIWHLVDTAAVVLALWDEYLSARQRAVISRGLGVSEEHARQLVAFWASLHDIGKAMPPFQEKNKDAFGRLTASGRYPHTSSGQRLRHERASQLLLVNLLAKIGYSTSPWRTSAAYRCAQILGGHHGRFGTSDYRECQFVLERCPPVGKGEWQVQRELLFEAVYGAVGRPAAPKQISVEAAVVVNGLVILADWLASQDDFLRGQQPYVASEATEATVREHFARMLKQGPTLVEKAGLGRVEFRGRSFADLFGYSRNPLQQSLKDELVGRISGPGLLLVTAVTGHGKTEAALDAGRAMAAASGVDGLYFALPTMATSNHMYERVVEWASQCVAGSTALTLLHSMAWLNTNYSGQTLAAGIDEVVCDDEDKGPSLAPSEWMRGSKRSFLASLAVGTIDQALTAVLRAKHNTLRFLGLSSKVFVVDEAHSYDPYMQQLLERLLSWLGKLRCPVVLLSATMPSSWARRLAAAYAGGAGRELPGETTVAYPGWLYVPADADQPLVEASARARRAIAAHRKYALDVDVRPVRHAHRRVNATCEPRSGSRCTVLQQVLADIVADGGCAAVVCNTVEDAQRTYVELRSWLAKQSTPPKLHLLHARMPAYDRERRTDELISQYGKKGERQPGIVVSTQVIEQSLDLDFDLVISDLAPIALLLQRAGRCWRRDCSPRPQWSSGPRLVVLDPRNGSGEHVRPPHWGEVYDAYLLRATHHVLVARAGQPVEVPGDVQELVEAVYVEGPAAIAGLADDRAALSEYDGYRAKEQVLRSIADAPAIPEPRTLSDLGYLHTQECTDVDLATRFGGESARVIACYVDGRGRWLDSERTVPLPEQGKGREGRFTEDEVSALLRHVIPVRADYLQGADDTHAPPAKWQANPWLREVVLLPHQSDEGDTDLARVGNRAFYLDDDLGLVNH